jgi:hypothetical protein
MVYVVGYKPGRAYRFVRFEDGTGRVWWKIAYQWLWMTWYVGYYLKAEVGSYSGDEEFKTREEAERFLASCRRGVEYAGQAGDVRWRYEGEAVG